MIFEKKFRQLTCTRRRSEVTKKKDFVDKLPDVSSLTAFDKLVDEHKSEL